MIITNMKKIYSAPCFEICQFEVVSVIATSGGLGVNHGPADDSAQLGKLRSKNPIWDDEI